MTETSPVTRNMTIKPGAGAMKAGGAGAPAGPDALDGAFAAIMDAAQGGVPGEAGLAAGGDGIKGGGAKLLALGAAQPIADDAAAVIQILPNAAQAKDVPTGEATLPEAVSSEILPGDAPAGGTEIATGAPAKPRRGNARPTTDEAPTDPLFAQAGLQLAATLAAPVQPPSQPIEQPSAKKKAVLAVDADAGSSSGAKAAITLSPAVKPAAEDGQTAEAPLAGTRFAAAPIPPKGDAPVAIAVQTGNAAAQSREGDQPGAGGKDGDERNSSRLAAVKVSIDAANDDSSVTATDPFHDILQSLPPVLQSQLGVQPVSGFGVDAPASTPAVASTGELLGNRVIDMGVSGQWIDRMAREIAALSEGTGHSRFQLMPPNLGRIQVDLWQGDDKTNVRLLTETDEAARRLREGQGALEASARAAALSLGTVSVEKSSDSFDSPRDQGQNPRQQAQGDFGNGNQQQASAQAQGQGGQGRGNTGLNSGGGAAVIGAERQAEPEQPVRAPRADDPRVRFA